MWTSTVTGIRVDFVIASKTFDGGVLCCLEARNWCFFSVVAIGSALWGVGSPLSFSIRANVAYVVDVLGEAQLFRSWMFDSGPRRRRVILCRSKAVVGGSCIWR